MQERRDAQHATAYPGPRNEPSSNLLEAKRADAVKRTLYSGTPMPTLQASPATENFLNQAWSTDMDS